MLKELFRRQPVYAALGFFLMLSIPVLGFLELTDTRLIDEQGNWVKSLKFALSLGLYLLTLAFFVPWMREGAPKTTTFKVLVGAVALAILFEIAWLWSAAALGVRAHYNYSGIWAVLYPLSGLFATVLVLGALLQGISTLRAQRAALNPALTVSIGWGLILTFVLTMAVAFPLSMTSGQHGGSIHGYGDGWFGWRVEKGDLRAAHFFSIHAMHFLPLAGFVVSRINSGAAGTWLVRLMAAAYTGFVLWLAMSTFQGQDLPRLLVAPF